MSSNKSLCKCVSIYLLVIFLFTGCSASSVKKQRVTSSSGEKASKKIQSHTTLSPKIESSKLSTFREEQRIEEYKVGLEDVLDISVYGEPDLSKIQRVRPDGKISLPLIGDIEAYRKTPIELRNEITKRFSKYVLRPKVTVLITEYQSKKVVILGEVAAPGLLRMSTNIPLLEGLSLAGGLTETADLRGAMLIRDDHILPIDFYSLLKQGDMRHNVTLKHNDKILVPSNTDNKVFVLGEVNRPGILRITDQLSIIEAITAAGGIRPTGKRKKVFVLRGGIANPEVVEVDIDKILKDKDFKENIFLSHGDIVYIPKTFITKMNTVIGYVNSYLSSLVLLESAIIQYPSAKSVIKDGRLPGSTTTTVTTRSDGSSETSIGETVPE